MQYYNSFASIAVAFFCWCIALATPAQEVIAYNLKIDGHEFPVFEKDITNSVTLAYYTPADASVRSLAKNMGLLSETEVNPHLRFLGGDIAYWTEQVEAGLSLKRLRLEFAARKAVLDAADRADVIIDDQGKLSFASQKIIARVLKEHRRIKKSGQNSRSEHAEDETKRKNASGLLPE
jgi:hypothetical protein